MVSIHATGRCGPRPCDAPSKDIVQKRQTAPNKRISALLNDRQHWRTFTIIGSASATVPGSKHAESTISVIRMPSRALAVGRELDDDRPPARAFQGDDDGAVRTSCAGLGKGGGGTGGRKHCCSRRAGSGEAGCGNGLNGSEADMARLQSMSSRRGRAAHGRERHGVLGSGADRLRGAGLRERRESIRSSGARAGRGEARHGGPPRGYRHRAGAAPGGAHHRSHQGGRGAGAGADGGETRERTEGGRSGGAIHGGARSGALQAEDGKDLPVPAGSARASGARQGSGGGGWDENRRWSFTRVWLDCRRRRTWR